MVLVGIEPRPLSHESETTFHVMHRRSAYSHLAYTYQYLVAYMLI